MCQGLKEVREKLGTVHIPRVIEGGPDYTTLRDGGCAGVMQAKIGTIYTMRFLPEGSITF